MLVISPVADFVNGFEASGLGASTILAGWSLGGSTFGAWVCTGICEDTTGFSWATGAVLIQPESAGFEVGPKHKLSLL